ncbi:hypothetical protein ATANTOWER_015613 [Ataeniobius toweri]|uniref:Uncharacterized protein n=1 Tax=Ataeniobius toweri TaxID=208326 RepID=A0ABU7B0I8_9TELE|nr:hypothetical protein [Ataeniobius toweri]
MAKIIAATLLLVIWANCFSDRTAHCDEFHSAGFTTAEIRKCRCSVSSSGRMKCPCPLIPENYKGQEDKLCRENQNVLFKDKNCRQPQIYKYNPKERLTLKHCLCCRIKNNPRDRTPTIKVFCGFSCFHPTPL